MEVDECVDDPRPWTKHLLLLRSSALVGRSLITERISRQKTPGWVGALEGTGSEWAVGAHVHRERTPVVQHPCEELKWR